MTVKVVQSVVLILFICVPVNGSELLLNVCYVVLR